MNDTAEATPRTRAEHEARTRADALIASTEHIAGRGALPKLAAEARTLASYTLQILEQLRDEHSIRVAVQQDRDRLIATRFPGAA